jgi:hypothetical protein
MIAVSILAVAYMLGCFAMALVVLATQRDRPKESSKAMEDHKTIILVFLWPIAVVVAVALAREEKGEANERT